MKSPYSKFAAVIALAMMIVSCTPGVYSRPAPEPPQQPGEAPLDPGMFPPEAAADTEIWVIETPGASATQASGGSSGISRAKSASGIEEVIVSAVRRHPAYDSPPHTVEEAIPNASDEGRDMQMPAVSHTPWYKDEPPGSASLLAGVPVTGKGEVKYVPLPLKHTDVNAVIEGYVGTVQVKQAYQNPYDTKIEAVYLFPLPERAAISEFLMVIGDRKIRGILRDREEAEALYLQARAQGYRASLLVQHRPNIFEQKVANIEPGKSIDIDITYFHTLEYTDGWYSFVFPTVVGPRYNPPGSSDPIVAVPRGSGTSAGPQPENGVAIEYLKPTERSGHDISIDVEVRAGLAIEEFKSTHEILTEQDEASVKVRLASQEVIPNRDFVLDFRVVGETMKSSLLTHQSASGQGYFTLMLVPPLDGQPSERRAMEMVFVIDCSGSMSGRPLEQAKQAVNAALDKLGEGDSFQIIRFSEGASHFGPAPISATRENLAKARRYLAGLSGSGGTQMIEGIKAALEFPHDPSRLRVVSFMTDGYIGNEAEILAAVNARIDASRIFSFGVGSSVNRYLLNRMAQAGRGVAAYIGLNDSSEEVMDSFFDRISRPVLSDISIDWGEMRVTDAYPSALPELELFTGRPLVMTGKFSGEASQIRVWGARDGERAVFMSSTPIQSGATLAKLWARLRIAELVDLQNYTGDHGGELAEAIRKTALEYQLVTSYTAFVAVDSSAKTLGDHGISVSQAVPAPDGVKYETTIK